MPGDRDQRTEAPTPKRRREARKDGKLARSPELVSWAALLVATVLVQRTFSNGERLVVSLLEQVPATAAHPDGATATASLGRGLRGVLGVVAPLVVAMPLLGVAGNLAQTGLVPTLSRLTPTWSHLDPRTGIRRLLSPTTGWETAKQLAKVALLALVAWRTISGTIPALTAGGPLSVTAVAGATAGRALSVARTVAAAGLVIAAVDYGVARRRVNRQLRMTKQEVRDELRNSDGNPLVKGAIRRKQRRLSRLRMMAAVASADAVVVNPTHVAVALRYAPGSGAPRVVARGVDSLALRIKAEARLHHVPMVEDRPLARALYAACALDQEIPADLYEAVARLLSFVYSLRRDGRSARLDGEAHRPPAPLLRELAEPA